MNTQDRDSACRDFSIRPSGKRPIAFRGEELASATSKRTSGQTSTRWHDLTLFKTEGGSYVLKIVFRTQWENEIDRIWAEVLADPVLVAEALEEHDPTPEGIGFPHGDSYREKQQRLEADLRVRFQDAVSELLEDLPGCEQVIP